jgi:hypothetical protein
VAQHLDDSREVTVEHQELPLAGEVGACPRGSAEPLFERLLERLGRRVLPGGQAASPGALVTLVMGLRAGEVVSRVFRDLDDDAL